MTVATIQEAVGNALPYYARTVAGKCNIEQEDAQQELMIRAWQMGELYEDLEGIVGVHELTLEQFLMTKLHWESRKLVRDDHRAHNAEYKALEEDTYQKSLTQYSPQEEICNEIAFQQELDRLPQMVSTILKERKLGNSLRNIASKTGYSFYTVRNVLRNY